MSTATALSQHPHPTVRRLAARAAAAGCTCGTVRGLLAWLRRKGVHQFRISAYTAAYNTRSATAARKAHPEAKRARADRRFRRQWLRKMRLALDALCMPAMGTLAEITAAADSIEQRRTHRDALLAEIRIAGAHIEAPIPRVPVGALIPCDADTARRAGAQINMCGKDAALILSRGSSHLVSAPPEVEWNKRGQPRTTARATRDNYVRSFAVVRDSQTADVALHTHESRLILPTPYAWEEAAAGGQAERVLRAYRTDSIGDDYHPAASDLRGRDPIAHIIERIEANRARRLEEQARLVAERAQAEGVWVCLSDSLRAGNCRTQSIAWAARHGLSIAQHYEAPALLDLLNGDEPGRARLAISAAIHRHRAEMERGYCDLAEHREQLSASVAA